MGIQILRRSLTEAIDVASDEARKSNSPWTKVGCVILDENEEIISQGHNRFPVEFMAMNPNIPRERMRPFSTHAEVNAASDAGFGAQIAVCTLMPCVDCVKVLAASGIVIVYYLESLDRDKEALDVAKAYNVQMIKL